MGLLEVILKELNFGNKFLPDTFYPSFHRSCVVIVFNCLYFERTEFRRMLADIELGVIYMVIFKDVSRLGREHIDTNYYLGKYFPEKQIRIVSILDNYDSAVGTYDEMLEIKTLLNDMYLRDTSRKIKTTIQTKRSMGEYTPKQPNPF